MKGTIFGIFCVAIFVIIGLVNPVLLVQILIVVGLIMWGFYLYDSASLKRQERKLLDMKRNPEKYEKELLDQWTKEDKRAHDKKYKAYNSQTPKFIKTIEKQIEDKDTNIIKTLINRSEDYIQSAHFEGQYDYNSVLWFYHKLIKFALEGRGDENIGYTFFQFTIEEAYSTNSQIVDSLSKKLEEVEFTELTDKQLKDLMKAFNRNLKFAQLTKKFPPEPLILKFYAYPKSSHLLFGIHPDNGFKGDIKKLTELFDSSLEGKDKILKDIEIGRKHQIKKSLKSLEKARSKEKLSAANAETFFTLSELYLHDPDPLEKIKAKSILREFIESANKSKITPKLKETIKEAEKRIDSI